MNFNDELMLLLKARYPVIYIHTIEEDRVEYIIRKNIKTNNEVRIHFDQDLKNKEVRFGNMLTNN